MRKDYRTHETFKKDIKFTTKLESFWFKIFLDQIKLDNKVKLISYEDNGVDNTGNFVKKSNSNADYKITYEAEGKTYTLPIEIKWAPNNMKATFKIANLQSYIKQDAVIVLFYNTCSVDLKKPKDYDLTRHISFLKDHLEHICWGVIACKAMEKMITSYPIEKPYSFGRKECVIVPSCDYHLYFKMRKIQ